MTESAEQMPHLTQTTKRRVSKYFVEYHGWTVGDWRPSGGRSGLLVLPGRRIPLCGEDCDSPGSGGKRMAKRPRKMSAEHIAGDGCEDLSR